MKEKKLMLKLWQQLLLAIMLLMLLVAIGAGFFQYHVEREAMTQLLERQNKKNFQLLYAAVIEPVISEDIPWLHGFVEELSKQDQDLFSVEIYNADNRVLLKWQRSIQLLINPASEFDQKIILQGQEFGSIKVSWSIDHFFQLIGYKILKTQFFLAVMLLLIVVLIMILLIKLIIQPINIINRHVTHFLTDEHKTGVKYILSSKELYQLNMAVVVLGQAFRKQVVIKNELRKTKQEIEDLSYRNNLILCSAAEGVMLIDSQALITYVNPAAAKITGWEVALLQNQFLTCLLHRAVDRTMIDASSGSLDMCTDFLNGEQVYKVFWHKQGYPFPVEYVCTPIIENDQISGSVITFKNINKRLVAERQLKKSEENQKAAELSNQLKSNFLANMSHEIRTPMHAIIGMSYLLSSTELNLKQVDYLDKIELSANLLLDIINDILDFSKIEAGQLTIEETDFRLGDVLDNVTNLTTLKAQKKGLKILFSVDQDVPYLLKGDPTRLGQIITNLVSNAVKFTEQGKIVISIQRVESEHDQIVLQFSVKDTGIGISEDQMESLFEPFNQADTSTTRVFGGTGLGLSICKHLVKMMNGYIWIESKLGQGSTFFFNVKFQVNNDDRKRWLSLSNGLRDLHVLIVGDEFTTLRDLKQALSSINWDIEETNTGMEAIAKVEENLANPFDLIFMDWHMPVMNGSQTMEVIKNIPGLKKVPQIIMLTAFGNEDIAKKVVLDKMDGYIEKPVDESSLLEVVMEIYGKKLELGESESKFVHPAQDIDLEQINDSTMSLNTKSGLAGFYEPGNAFLILVVEDNPVNLLLTQNILKQLELNSVSAANGEEAIYTFKSEEPTLILMDCHMPIMDGLSATKKIRQIEKQAGGHVPIIALSASSKKEDSDACITAGMDDYLSKPFNKKQLLKIMQPYLKQKNANIKTVEFELSSGPKFNARILLVEDNQINREIAIHFFKKLNLNVEVAHDGLEAINKIKENELTYDCVFMDVKMPVMDGLEATRSIRRDTRFQSLPIIAMTAHAMKGDRELCLDAGMNDYISKPIGVVALDRVLRKWVGSKEEMGNTLDSLVKPQRTVCGNSFPKLPGIDVPDDYRGEKGQEEFYRKMLVRFHQENHQFKSKIQGALEAGDVKLAQFLIHSIRGSTSALGAKRLSVAAEHIESLFRKGQKNIDNTLWNGFFDEMEKVLSSIQTLKTRETEL